MLLAQLPGNPDSAGLGVDVGPSQRGQLTPSETAENAEEHQCAVPGTDCIGQGVDLRDRQGGACGAAGVHRAGLYAAAPAQRVHADAGSSQIQLARFMPGFNRS